MGNQWDIHTIRAILPQKYPFLFIDKVLEFNEAEGEIVCLKNFTINDYFFKGHFPNNPIVPGVIMIEAMAQASILLYAGLKPHIAEKHPDYFLGKVEAKFLKQVKPGDSLILKVNKEKILDKGGIVQAMTLVDEETAAHAQIAFGVKLPSC